MKFQFKKQWLIFGFTVILGLSLGVITANKNYSVQAKTNLSMLSDTTNAIVDEETNSNYEKIKDFESILDESLKKKGWVYASYKSNIVDESQLYRSADAQFPKSALTETWFHFDDFGKADQQITFMTINGQKVLTEIYFNGIYRSLAESFTPINESSSSPSFYFYLASEDPNEAAKENVQILIREVQNDESDNPVSEYVIERLFLTNMYGYTKLDENIQGTKHLITLDSESAKPIHIENYFTYSNGNILKYSEVSDITYKLVVDMPDEIQYYFEQYDNLDWTTIGK